MIWVMGTVWGMRSGLYDMGEYLDVELPAGVHGHGVLFIRRVIFECGGWVGGLIDGQGVGPF